MFVLYFFMVKFWQPQLPVFYRKFYKISFHSVQNGPVAFCLCRKAISWGFFSLPNISLKQATEGII